eukprot:20784-Heterococcus_DN1.PRE.6
MCDAEHLAEPVQHCSNSDRPFESEQYSAGGDTLLCIAVVLHQLYDMAQCSLYVGAVVKLQRDSATPKLLVYDIRQRAVIAWRWHLAASEPAIPAAITELIERAML